MTDYKDDPFLLYDLPVKPDINRAIVALLLNMLIWPGVGSIIGGVKIGWYQAVFCASVAFMLMNMSLPIFRPGLFLLGLLLALFLLLFIWVWGLMTGVRLIRYAAGKLE